MLRVLSIPCSGVNITLNALQFWLELHSEVFIIHSLTKLGVCIQKRFLSINLGCSSSPVADAGGSRWKSSLLLFSSLLQKQVKKGRVDLGSWFESTGRRGGGRGRWLVMFKSQRKMNGSACQNFLSIYPETPANGMVLTIFRAMLLNLYRNTLTDTPSSVLLHDFKSNQDDNEVNCHRK